MKNNRKYELKNIQKVLSVVLSGTVLFSVLEACKQTEKKPANPESTTTSKVTFLDENEIPNSDLTSADLDELIEKLYLKYPDLYEKYFEKNINVYNDPVPTDLTIVTKGKIDRLLKKHFKDVDIPKISIKGIASEKNEQPKIILEIQNVFNKGSLSLFLKELQEICELSVLIIDNNILAELDNYNFGNIEELIINSSNQNVGFADLSNFEKIDKLELNKVNVINMPKTIKKISFNGFNHNQYHINSELNQLDLCKDLSSIEINNMDTFNILVPSIKNIYIKFINCTGYINLSITNSSNVVVKNESYESYKNCIIISGKITEDLYIVSNSSNVVTKDIVGNPKSTLVIEFPEGDYIKSPNSYSEPNEEILIRKKP